MNTKRISPSKNHFNTNNTKSQGGNTNENTVKCCKANAK